MKIQSIPVSQIQVSEYNPRKDLKPGDPEYESLSRSIKRFGYVDPIIWNRKSGNLVAGHQRFKILKARGDKTISVVVVELEDADEKALNVAHNKISGSWNMPKLKDLMLELDVAGFDTSLTGFSEPELEQVLAHEPKISLKDLEPRALKMAWVLVGIPIGDYPEIAELVEKAGKVRGAIVEVTANDKDAHADR